MVEIQKDGYWHCIVESMMVEYAEYDMDFDTLIQSIVSPYKNNEEVTIEGHPIKKKFLQRIRIYHSNSRKCLDNEISINELYKYIKDYNEQNNEGLLDNQTTRPKQNNNKNIFIVHGHDDGMKQTVARFLEHLGLNPIILHEQPNEGQTIIEKLEKNIDNCSYGIVLYSPCDRGGINKENIELKPRARQNVVFEHGYLIGKFGRGNVCCLLSEGVEKPGDSDGILYISYTDGWDLKLARELKTAKYDIDLNKLADSKVN